MVTSHHLTSQIAAERQRDLRSSATHQEPRAGHGSHRTSALPRAVLALAGVRARGRVRRVRRAERAGC